jgi:leucyl/phenylalanyl-tRNA---protein transferase
MTLGRDLTPELLLYGYRQGIFPMAEGRDDPEVFWVDPEQRGILPIGGFHISRSLQRRMRTGGFRTTADHSFVAVMQGCAERAETWISPDIIRVYAQLHDRGQAHSVEVWSGDHLVGGVYGVALGAAFFGESMFSRVRDASKVALACLMDQLQATGYRLHDTQFLTPHLASLGGVEISRADFRRQLQAALAAQARFTARAVRQPDQLAQLSAQIS